MTVRILAMLACLSSVVLGWAPERALASSPTEPAIVQGNFGPGATYLLFRPQNWNGRLVVYAHGLVPAALPVGLPPEGTLLIEALGAQGFAVAYSSYSENGYAVKDGAQRTHQLRGLFASNFGIPQRTYLLGPSLGGAIVAMLIEKYPDQYAGALPFCGVLGGFRLLFNYSAQVRALFDFFYPGVLPGTVIDVPARLDVNSDIVAPALAAIQADPSGVSALAAIDQIPVPFSDATELVQSVLTALAFHAANMEDVLDHTHGHLPISNRNTVYTGALPASLLLAINAGVERYDATADATEYVQHYFDPSGALQVPVLTLHTTLDPVVPLIHELVYREIVAAAGASDLLVQRQVPRYGHCTFTNEELNAAFLDLVTWVEAGIKPAP
jgi:pimeloyl-ACP methyl ester carboxylesterase